MGRFVAVLGALAACYGPHPQAGAACGANQACPDPLVCRTSTMTCETTGDGTSDAAIPIGDVGTDGGDPSLAHLHAAPGWSVAVLVDFSGVVPYNADDFDDPGPIDNQARAVSALYPPYDGSLAIAAGRAVIELDAADHPTVHDYRPAMRNTTGPDEINHLAFLAGTLSLAAASQNSGDGLYTLSPSWDIDRQLVLNNVSGMDLDATGAFDSVGTATPYYIDQNGIDRVVGANPPEVVVAGSSNFDGLVVTPDFIYSAHLDTDLVRVTPGMHAMTVLDSGMTDMEPTDHGAFGSGVLAIKDRAQLVAYDGDGGSTVGVFSDDPAWFWRNSTLVAAPHPLAGKILVIESNRALNVDRLLVVTPP